jgi:hypothetical protein
MAFCVGKKTLFVRRCSGWNLMAFKAEAVTAHGYSRRFGRSSISGTQMYKTTVPGRASTVFSLKCRLDTTKTPVFNLLVVRTAAEMIVELGSCPDSNSEKDSSTLNPLYTLWRIRPVTLYSNMRAHLREDCNLQLSHIDRAHIYGERKQLMQRSIATTSSAWVRAVSNIG